METILTNLLIITFSIIVWSTNHYFETKELEAIENEIKEELEKDDEAAK